MAGLDRNIVKIPTKYMLTEDNSLGNANSLTIKMATEKKKSKRRQIKRAGS